MPIGSAVHDRTFPLCESLNYREWSGYYAVSAYEAHHEHEYNAIRNAAALIDISPLFKYKVSGKDATRLVDRVVTRDLRKVGVGSVIYTPWCDEHGKTIDDGTVARLAENVYRWTAADPSLRWFKQNSLGLDVQIEDVSESVAALALQGPTSGRMLEALAEADVANLKYFKVTSGKIAGVAGRDLAHRLHGRSRLRDLDAVEGRRPRLGRAHGEGQGLRRPRGRHAGARRLPHRGRPSPDRGRLQRQQEGSDRLAALLAARDGPFATGRRSTRAASWGRTRCAARRRAGPKREIVGLEIDWNAIEAIYERLNLAPQIPAAASRVPVPVYREGEWVGKATSTTWSPTLKKLIALATVSAGHNAVGTRLEMEYTVEAVRHRVGATVVKTPFFNPPRKTAAI